MFSILHGYLFILRVLYLHKGTGSLHYLSLHTTKMYKPGMDIIHSSNVGSQVTRTK